MRGPERAAPAGAAGHAGRARPTTRRATAARPGAAGRAPVAALLTLAALGGAAGCTAGPPAPGSAERRERE
ncbi:MAG TPA: hypothetical protein VNV66_08650, partial [Pilimelia sp.]|nr:hypothetical protein [Pilimelia sp.]